MSNYKKNKELKKIKAIKFEKLADKKKISKDKKDLQIWEEESYPRKDQFIYAHTDPHLDTSMNSHCIHTCIYYVCMVRRQPTNT